MRKQFSRSYVLGAFAMVGAMAVTSSASAKGRFTTFEAPGAGSQPGQGTFAERISANGVIAGDFFDKKFVSHGYIRRIDGTIEVFDAPGAGGIQGQSQGTYVAGFNDNGEISGFYYTDDGYPHGYLRTIGGKFKSFDATDNPMTGTFPDGINNHAVTVGSYYVNDVNPHGFLRRKKNITLIDVPGSIGTNAYNIDGNGVIVGDYKISAAWRGYLRAPDGTFTLIDAPGAGSHSGTGTIPLYLNSNSEIVGLYIDDDFVSHGFLRSVDGTITPIDILGAGTGENEGTEAHRINDTGVIVGDFIDSADVAHGFIRKPNGSVKSFDAPHAGAVAGAGTFVLGLNDDGATIGWAIDKNLVSHGFVRN